MNKKELMFAITTALLSLIVIGVVIYSVNFLVGNIGKTLNQNPPSAAAEFNLKGLKDLGIVK